MTNNAPRHVLFEAKYEPNAETGCWDWTASTSGGGYGRFAYPDATGRARLGLAHRYSYEFHVGPIPDGLHIDHLCRNRGCVNPEHLEAVTPLVNVQREMAVKTHCPSGHPYKPPHLGVNKQGWRFCKTCMNESVKRYQARKKQELTGPEDRRNAPDLD